MADTLARPDSSDNSDLETFSDDENSKDSSKKRNGQTSTSAKDYEKSKNPVSNGRLPCSEDENPSWRSFLGSSEEKSTILIRWPDGSRDSWSQSTDTKLQSLLLYIAEQGCELENHDVVTNFPRRQLNTEDLQQETLQQLGLHPRETVFVHLKDC